LALSAKYRIINDHTAPEMLPVDIGVEKLSLIVHMVV